MANSPQNATADTRNQAMERLGYENVHQPSSTGETVKRLLGESHKEPSVANFILSYDLNGPHPTHAEMDKHLRALGSAFVLDRILETVWYVGGPTNSVQLREYVQRILSPNDLLIVAEVLNAAWTHLLVDTAGFKAAFEANQRRSLAA